MNWCQKIEKTMIERENIERKTSKVRKSKVKNVARERSNSKISKEISSKNQNTESHKLEKSKHRKLEISTRQFRKMSLIGTIASYVGPLFLNIFTNRQSVFQHPPFSFQFTVFFSSSINALIRRYRSSKENNISNPHFFHEHKHHLSLYNH